MLGCVWDGSAGPQASLRNTNQTTPRLQAKEPRGLEYGNLLFFGFIRIVQAFCRFFFCKDLESLTF